MTGVCKAYRLGAAVVTYLSVKLLTAVSLWMTSMDSSSEITLRLRYACSPATWNNRATYTHVLKCKNMKEKQE